MGQECIILLYARSRETATQIDVQQPLPISGQQKLTFQFNAPILRESTTSSQF